MTGGEEHVFLTAEGLERPFSRDDLGLLLFGKSGAELGQVDIQLLAEAESYLERERPQAAEELTQVTLGKPARFGELRLRTALTLPPKGMESLPFGLLYSSRYSFTWPSAFCVCHDVRVYHCY